MSKFFKLSYKPSTVSSRQGGNGVLSQEVGQFLEESSPLLRTGSSATPAVTAEASKVQLHFDLPLLAENHDGAHPAVEAYRALRTRLLRLQALQHIRSVAVTSALQGEGKTLTTINLALCYAQLFNTPVLMVDGDLRTRGLTLRVMSSSPPGLAEVLDGALPFESSVRTTNVANLFVLSAGGSSTAASELYARPTWKEFMDWCRHNFKLVLIDSPPILGLADLELISAVCDGLLMVVRARKTEREVLQDASRQLDNRKLLGVVLNGHDFHKTYYGYYYRT